MNSAHAVPYTDQETSLEGFAASPKSGKHPIVILCHAWKGRDSFICEKAELMAEWGYVGFALDLYGKGVLGRSKEECAALKKPFLEDRRLLQRRLLKGYEAALSLPHADPSRVAVIGYGFGGLSALDLARSGVALKGAVSVYGHFEPPAGVTTKPIQAKILILHGYNDPVATQGHLRIFEKEMEEAHVDWQAHIFGGTLHAFATPGVNDPASGLAHHPINAERALQCIKLFLKEIFLA
jgi:dienelactone hydrolase